MYSPKRCARTFPLPVLPGSLASKAEEFHAFRASVCSERGIGLTELYGAFHQSTERSDAIGRLRTLHASLNDEVLKAFGWSDLANGATRLHETPVGSRFGLRPETTVKTLDRLLELNRQRYAEEVKAGLHEKSKTARKKSPPRKKSTGTTGLPTATKDLFET